MPSVVLLNQTVADRDRGGIGFAVMADDTSVTCFISQEALSDHFGAIAADAASLIGAFHARAARIRSAAKCKIADGAFEPDGSVLLRTVDFWM